MADWVEPRWQFYRKHRPIPGMEWTDIVKRTKNNAPAKYHPSISLDRQAQLEMECLEHNFLKEGPSKRTYYWDTGSVVGASCGEETRWILAEWSIQDEVHGRPITWDEIQQKLKGAQET